MKQVIALLFVLSLLAAACSNPPAPHHRMGEEERGNAYADSINKGLIAPDTMKRSIARTAMRNIGNAHVHINYHSPGVKGRIIWGGLVPYGQVWVTGAHSATSVQFSEAVEIAGKKVEAGTYALFTIPGEKEWVVILNKNHQQHLADDYNQTEDVLRTTVLPTANNMVQRLTYSVNKTGDAAGTITMEWEKLKLELPFKSL